MGGQWEAVARRSLRELPRDIRDTGLPRCVLWYTHVSPRARVCICAPVCTCVRSCSVRRVELVDDPGDVNDFHGKFSPPKMAKLAVLATPARYPGPELALINGLSMYIFRCSLPSSPLPLASPPHTLRQIYETESTDCARGAKIFAIIDRRLPSFMIRRLSSSTRPDMLRSENERDSSLATFIIQ